MSRWVRSIVYIVFVLLALYMAEGCFLGGQCRSAEDCNPGQFCQKGLCLVPEAGAVTEQIEKEGFDVDGKERLSEPTGVGDSEIDPEPAERMPEHLFEGTDAGALERTEMPPEPTPEDRARLCLSKGTFWSYAPVGTQAHQATALAVDQQGQVYTAGSFQGSLSFCVGHSDNCQKQTLQSLDKNDSYLLKQSACGDILWVKHFGGANDQSLKRMHLGEKGTLYITGTYRVEFREIERGTKNLFSRTDQNMHSFVLELSPSGKVLWSLPVGSEHSSFTSIHGLAVKGDSLYLGGRFKGRLSFGALTKQSKGAGNGFVAKFNKKSQQWVWVRTLGGTGPKYIDEVRSLYIDSNEDIYINGSFSSSIEFEGCTFTCNLSATGELSAYVAKIDKTGTWKWARRIYIQGGQGILSRVFAGAMAMDSKGHIVLSGDWQAKTTLVFDEKTKLTDTDTPGKIGGPIPGFVAKIDGNGKWLWAAMCASNFQYVHHIAIDTRDRIFLGGKLDTHSTKSVVFTSSDRTTLTVEGPPGNDFPVFHARMSPGGAWQWIKLSSPSTTGIVGGLGVDSEGSVVGAGGFKGKVMRVDGRSLQGSTDNRFVSYIWKSKRCDANHRASVGWLVAPVGSSAKEMGTHWGQDVVMDAEGFIYQAGSFLERMTLCVKDGNACKNTTLTTPQAGQKELFLAKYDSSGRIIWVKPFGNVSKSSGTRVVIGTDGFLYTAGYTSQDKPTKKTLGFVAKWDRTGKRVWQIDTQQKQSDFVRFIDVKSVGSKLYVVGMFQGKLVIGKKTYQAKGLGDSFVAELDARDGKWLWVRTMSGDGGDYFTMGKDITVASTGHMYLTGNFGRDITFEGCTSCTLKGGGGSYGFVAKLDRKGNWLWTRRFYNKLGSNQAGYASANRSVVDSQGHLIVVGEFKPRSTLFFSNSVEVKDTITVTQGRSSYAAKIDSSGNWLWAVKIGGRFTYARAVTVDNNDQIYVGGRLDTGADKTIVFTSTDKSTKTIKGPLGSGMPGFIAKLSNTGIWKWVKSTTAQSNASIVRAVVDCSGNLFVTGSFAGPSISVDGRSVQGFKKHHAFIWKVKLP